MCDWDQVSYVMGNRGSRAQDHKLICQEDQGSVRDQGQESVWDQDQS